MATTNYSGSTTGGYESARRGVENQYTSNLATNAYGRFLSQQRGTRDLDDSTRNFKSAYPGYRAQFSQRGLSGGGINSGVMHRSMGNYIGDYQRNYGRAQQDLTQGLQQYDLQRAQMDAWRENELADIEMQRARDIATTASQLDMLRNLLGGL